MLRACGGGSDMMNSTTQDGMAPISGAGKIPETMWRAAKAQEPTTKCALAASWSW
jgi:hypothetical protein